MILVVCCITLNCIKEEEREYYSKYVSKEATFECKSRKKGAPFFTCNISFSVALQHLPHKENLLAIERR